ncbi:hypothetical protein Hanom_Chr10g00925371 [Helianthus anomalus]
MKTRSPSMAKGHPRLSTQTALVTRPATIPKETHRRKAHCVKTLGSIQSNFAPAETRTHHLHFERYNHMHNKGAKGCVMSDNGSVCDAITPICIFWCGTVTYEVRPF